MKFLKIVLCIFLTQTTTNFAQKAATPTQSTNNSIEQQFQTLYKESNNYQIYKVVKKASYLSLQKNVSDSINKYKVTVTEKQNLILDQNKKLTKLQQEIDGLNQRLTESSTKEDQIAFLGIALTKANYNLFVWGIIIIILILLLYFIYQFKNSNVVTRETKELLSEIEQEFEEHKRKSIEREQQLRRKLQDEINKQRGV